MDAEQGNGKSKEDSNEGKQSVTVEFVWESLGLPGKPPLEMDSSIAKSKINANELAAILQAKRDEIAHNSEQSMEAMPREPGPFTDMLIKLGRDLPPQRKFDDLGTVPSIDYTLLLKCAMNQASGEEVYDVLRNSRFRVWWKAEKLVEEFVSWISDMPSHDK